MVQWASGLLALAALAACLIAPIFVAAAGMDGFAARHEALKSWLLPATLIYFVAGIIFYRRWRREE